MEIQNSMFHHFHIGERKQFFELWNEFVPPNVRDNDSVAQKLEFYLNIYFATSPMRKGSQDPSETDAAMLEFKSFLETRGSTLSQTTEFLPFYALPFVPNPKSHPSYKELFTVFWVSDLKTRLEKFLTLALKSAPQPRLFELYKGGGGAESRSQLLQAQQKMMDSERKTATYMKRHNKVQADYHNLIGITADLVDALEATIQGKPITPEDLQMICSRLFNNHMRQSVDLTRPGTAGDVLRASVMPSQHGQGEMSDPFPALDYEKIKQALSTAAVRQKGFILQALRWRLTHSSPGDQRDGIITAYIHNDILGCAQAGQHRETILECLRSEDTVIKQYSARLLNTVASLCSGRGYLSHSTDLLRDLMTNLRQKENDPLTNENILGALQKLSLRRNLQSAMIEEGVVEWLVRILEDNDALSDYTLEYSVALLMNLCLRTAGKKMCVSIANQTLKVLSDLLGHDNQEIRPYVNGALYSILAIPSIREEAKAMGMEEILKCFIKDDQPDMNRQIEFIIKQLNSEEQVDDAESDDEEEDEDEEDQDAMEADLDKDELLVAQPGELSGEKLLTTEFISQSHGHTKRKRNDHVGARNEPLQRPVTPGHRKLDTLMMSNQPRGVPQPDSRPASRTNPALSRPTSQNALARPPTRSGSRPASQDGVAKVRPRSRPSTQDRDQQAASTQSLSRSGSQISKQHNQPSKRALEKLGPDVDVKEYESAFGSRPRIPRTPDVSGKRPSSRETPQPKYSESGPRPSSAGRTSTTGTPRKESTSSRPSSKPQTPSK
ncbi:lisH domain-containing protein ARMC9-like isoform X2 [Liolophura sinensis]